MKKLKMISYEVDGKKYEVRDIEEVFPSVAYEGEIRSGQGNPIKLDKVKGKAAIELEEYMNENNLLDFLNYRQN